jgi:hypothetical protein
MPIQPKSKAQSPDAPSVVRATSLDRSAHRSFLADVVIDHGPRDVLGRLFLLADTRLREKGIRLSFASLEELVAVNKANSDSWRPILPLFDPEVSDVGADNAHAMLGRDASGEVVCAHGCRIFNLGATTLKEEIERLRLFYRDPEASRGPGESMTCTVPIAETTRGEVLFTGAAWYRPDYRKTGIMPTLSTLNRAIFVSRWDPPFTFSFMAPELIKAGVAKACRMPHVDWEVTMMRTPVLRDGVIPAAMIRCDAEENRQTFREYVAESSMSSDAKIDRGIDDRSADQKLAG